jgi:glucose/arabinose dehydrogenase
MMPRLAIAALALAACSSGNSPTPSAEGAAPPAGAGTLGPTLGGRLNAPAGLQVTYWARLPGARAMALGPDGAVYVSQPGANQVTRLADNDGDGVAEDARVAVRGLDEPFGLAFRNGELYVANTGGVVRATLGPDGVATGPLQTVATYSAGGGHSSRSIAFGADGALYVSIGSTCNVCEEQSADRAAVMRFDLAAGGQGRVFARGLRNAVGIALHPTSGELWVSQHERDNIRPNHQDLPPEEINVLQDGGDYGWPYCHSTRVPNPEFGDAARCARTIAPALAMQAHSAPMMLAFLDRATALPADYRGDALLAFHGSWNRDVPTGAKVVRVRVRDGRPVSYEDFVTGWQTASGERWGRPVGIVVARDGAVLVSDDAGGAVFRVAP